MANLSTVYLEVELMKKENSIYPPKAVVELIKDISYDEGWQNDDGTFTVYGRWNFENNLKTVEIKKILLWLREYDYDKMVFNYVDYEESEGFVSVGRATYDLGLGETRLKVEYASWRIEDYMKEFLKSDLPQMVDYEENEALEDWEEAYDMDTDKAWEDVANHLDENFLGKEKSKQLKMDNEKFYVLPA